MKIEKRLLQKSYILNRYLDLVGYKEQNIPPGNSKHTQEAETPKYDLIQGSYLTGEQADPSQKYPEHRYGGRSVHGKNLKLICHVT